MPQIKPEVFLDYVGTAKQAANTTLPYEANIVTMLAKNVANLHTQQTLSDISIHFELRVRSNFFWPGSIQGFFFKNSCLLMREARG